MVRVISPPPVQPETSESLLRNPDRAQRFLEAPKFMNQPPSIGAAFQTILPGNPRQYWGVGFSAKFARMRRINRDPAKTPCQSTSFAQSAPKKSLDLALPKCAYCRFHNS
jgi:hypothetical protein